ncbi:MAG: acetylxylan esterase [Clostridia bacterium]|nr:acetylxylan esterase [Clostridia bacterium]
MIPNGLLCHDTLTKTIKGKLAYDETKDFREWKADLKAKLTELIGLDVIAENACPLKMEVEEEVKMEGYTQLRFTFESEIGSVVNCYLLTPDTGKQKYPVVITLQGHNESGVHSSIGDPWAHETLDYDTGRGTFAIQAVKEGYVALALDQRGMGERRAKNLDGRRVSLDPASGNCYFETQTALLLGRTILGERCWDISRAIDLLSNFPQCDLERIAITGNSGGGTASYYAACLDERIKICAPSCGVCSYAQSILKYYHCSCNYIPSASRYFDMFDLSGLIAPRRLAVLAGKYDTAFRIEGVLSGFETVRKIYESAGVKENCRLIVSPKGHWWNVDLIWPAIKEEFERLG